MDTHATEALTHGPVAWGRQMLVDPDFVAAVALLGVAGFGGNLADLPPAAKARVRAAVSLYRQICNPIRESVAHLLTPIPEGRQPLGWTAIQFVHESSGIALLFVFRLDVIGQRRLRLRGLDPGARDALGELTGSGGIEHTLSGRDLMRDGGDIHIPRPLAAHIWRIERVSMRREGEP